MKSIFLRAPAVTFCFALIFSLFYPSTAPARALPKAWLFDGERLIRAEIARDDQSRARGLMYRTWIMPTTGMLFVFEPPQTVSFWMKNTLIPLEMRFYDQFGRAIAYYPHAMPCTTDPCPLYPSFAKATYVLETRAQFRATPRVIPPLRLLLED